MTFTGATKREAMLKAILGTCKPCCGSGSGRRIPNGCSGCPCCPCSCWWATTWHKSISKTNLLRATGGAVWTLTDNTLANIAGDPEEMYLGDVASDESQCTIGGLAAIDDNNDIITDTDNPAYPRWEGDLTYTDGVITTVLHVVIKLQFTLSWTCGGSVVPDSFTWSGTTYSFTSGPGFLIGGGVADYEPIVDGNYGLAGTLADCSGTIALSGEPGTSAGITLPSLTIEMLTDPNCSGSGSS